MLSAFISSFTYKTNKGKITIIWLFLVTCCKYPKEKNYGQVVVEKIRKGMQKEKEDKQLKRLDLGIVANQTIQKTIEKHTIAQFVHLGF